MEAARFKKDLQEAIKEIVAAQKIDSPVYTFLHDLFPPSEQQESDVSSKAVGESPEKRTTRKAAKPSQPSQPVAGLPAGETDQSAKQLLDLGRQAISAAAISTGPSRSLRLFGYCVQMMIMWCSSWPWRPTKVRGINRMKLRVCRRPLICSNCLIGNYQ